MDLNLKQNHFRVQENILQMIVYAKEAIYTLFAKSVQNILRLQQENLKLREHQQDIDNGKFYTIISGSFMIVGAAIYRNTGGNELKTVVVIGIILIVIYIIIKLHELIWQ